MPTNKRFIAGFGIFWFVCLVLGLAMTGLGIWVVIELISYLQRH